jgi:hypothetical protein
LADLALENKDYELRRKCLNDITNHTITLNKLVDFLPAICSMKIFDSELVPHTITTTATTNTTNTATDYGNKELNIQ